MRIKRSFLSVIAAFSIVILGGCGGGDKVQSDLERTAEHFNAALVDTSESYTFGTGGVVRFGEMTGAGGQKSGRGIYNDCLRVDMACNLTQARAFFEQAEITAVDAGGKAYSDSRFFVNGDEKECALNIECPTEEKVKYIVIGPFKSNFDGDKTEVIFERKSAGT